MADPVEFTLEPGRGVKLHGRRWPSAEARAVIAFIHGYADHSGRYGHLAQYLAEHKIEFSAADLRGHGKSSGKRGHIGSFSEYLDDAGALLKKVRSEAGDRPVFLCGHSMGGLVAMTYGLERGGEGIAGIAVSSPFLGVAMAIPPAKENLGRIMSKVYPSFSIPSGIDPADLSHDRSVGVAYAADPLVFKTATARWYTEAMEAIRKLKAAAPRFEIPILILQAGDDKLADPRAVMPFCDRLGSHDKKYMEFPGFYHEIFNENGKEKPMKALRNWITQRSKTGTDSGFDDDTSY